MTTEIADLEKLRDQIAALQKSLQSSQDQNNQASIKVAEMSEKIKIMNTMF